MYDKQSSYSNIQTGRWWCRIDFVNEVRNEHERFIYTYAAWIDGMIAVWLLNCEQF